MTESAPKWRLFSLILLILFAGCSQLRHSSLDEEKEPQFVEGQRRATRRDWDGAIQSFERALQSNPNNAAAHLALAVLYDQKKNDFISAIYHYQRHLVLRPASSMADVVKGKITDCIRELAKTAQYAVLTREVQRDVERLTQTNALLKGRVEFLQAELSRRPQYLTNYITNFVGVQVDPRSSSRLTQPAQPLESPSEAPDETPAQPVARRTTDRTEVPRGSPRVAQSKPSAPTTRHQATPPERRQREPNPTPTSTRPRAVHTVRPGETLAALASRYGVSVQALKAANPGAAGGVRSGQKIDIPK